MGAEDEDPSVFRSASNDLIDGERVRLTKKGGWIEIEERPTRTG